MGRADRAERVALQAGLDALGDALQKLAASDRTQAAVIAFRRGLIV